MVGARRWPALEKNKVQLFGRVQSEFPTRPAGPPNSGGFDIRGESELCGFTPDSGTEFKRSSNGVESEFRGAIRVRTELNQSLEGPSELKRS